MKTRVKGDAAPSIDSAFMTALALLWAGVNSVASLMTAGGSVSLFAGMRPRVARVYLLDAAGHLMLGCGWIFSLIRGARQDRP